MLLALLLAAQTYGPQHLPPVADAEDPLVDAAGAVPGLIVKLQYATPRNIAGRALYDGRCLATVITPLLGVALDGATKELALGDGLSLLRKL